MPEAASQKDVSAKPKRQAPHKATQAVKKHKDQPKSEQPQDMFQQLQPDLPESNAKTGIKESDALTYIGTVKNLALRHLKTVPDRYERAFTNIFTVWFAAPDLESSHLLDACEELGLLDNEETRPDVFLKLIQEKFMKVSKKEESLTVGGFLNQFKPILEKYPSKIAKDTNFELFQLALLRYRNLRDHSPTATAEFAKFASQNLSERVWDAYEVYKDRIHDYISAGPEKTAFGDIQKATDTLLAFTKGLQDAPLNLKEDTFTTISNWLSETEKFLGYAYKDSRTSAEWTDVTAKILNAQKELLPNTFLEKDFETYSELVIKLFSHSHEHAVPELKKIATLFIPDSEKRASLYVEKYVTSLSQYVDHLLGSNDDVSKKSLVTALKNIKKDMALEDQPTPANSNYQIYFDQIRTKIECAAQQGLLTDNETLEAESTIAAAFLSPAQRIGWLHDLTDGNLAVANPKDGGAKILITFLAKEFGAVLDAKKAHKEEPPVVTTGRISAGYLRGDLAIFFHATALGETSDRNDGIFYHVPKDNFEAYSDAESRVFGAVSLFKSVQESMRCEFEQLVNAPQMGTEIVAEDTAKPTASRKKKSTEAGPKPEKT